MPRRAILARVGELQAEIATNIHTPRFHRPFQRPIISSIRALFSEHYAFSQ